MHEQYGIVRCNYTCRAELLYAHWRNVVGTVCNRRNVLECSKYVPRR